MRKSHLSAQFAGRKKPAFGERLFVVENWFENRKIWQTKLELRKLNCNCSLLIGQLLALEKRNKDALFRKSFVQIEPRLARSFAPARLAAPQSPVAQQPRECRAHSTINARNNPEPKSIKRRRRRQAASKAASSVARLLLSRKASVATDNATEDANCARRRLAQLSQLIASLFRATQWRDARLERRSFNALMLRCLDALMLSCAWARKTSSSVRL